MSTRIEPMEDAIIPFVFSHILGDRDALIAGGYCRDKVLGRQARDVDFWVHGDDVTVDILVSRLKRLELKYQEFGWYDKELHSEHITSVLKVGCVDIIVCDIPPLEMVQDHFDCNLNQFILRRGEKQVEFVGAIPPSEGFCVVGEYKSIERRDRMQALWQEYYDKVQKNQLY